MPTVQGQNIPSSLYAAYIMILQPITNFRGTVKYNTFKYNTRRYDQAAVETVKKRNPFRLPPTEGL